MPIRDTGFGLETFRDGKWVPIEPQNVKMSLAVGDERVFAYDEDAGILKLNKSRFPEGTLEQITSQLEQGKEIHLMLPFEPKPMNLKGLKTVSYFTQEELSVPIEEPETTHYRDTRTLWQRVKEYFLGH